MPRAGSAARFAGRSQNTSRRPPWCGWHSYRASKAALNMLIKNFAIELGRKHSRHIIVGLQPGTTDTALSAPFQRNLPEGQLQTPDYTARQLLMVMRKLRPEDSGGLFDFLGIPFTP